MNNIPYLATFEKLLYSAQRVKPAASGSPEPKAWRHLMAEVTRTNNDPSVKNAAYIAKQADWTMVEALMGGTRAMRAAGQIFLPQEANESGEAYKNRLKRSFLFNAFEKTVRTYASKPFKNSLLSATIFPKILSNFSTISTARARLSP